MDIKRLTHFIALVEEGRFARAAERVHLSQAAFSRSIQALESQTGLRLFDREPGGAALTLAGKEVLKRARALVFDSSCLERDIELLKSGDGGQLTIGVAPVAAAVILSPLLAKLQIEASAVVTRVRFGGLPVLIEMLENQSLDICFGDPRLIDEPGRYGMTDVGRPVGALVCRAGHPLARNGHADQASLARFGLATISTPPAFLNALAKGFGFDSRSAFPIKVECDDFHLIAKLVSTSDVIGLMPRAMADAKANRLRRLEYRGAAPVLAHLNAMWLKGRTLSPIAKRAISLAKDHKPPAASPAR